MKKSLLFLLIVGFSLQISIAQETFFQTGHTHDILKVCFSPDDSQLVSYSANDERFILWDVKSGRQVWTRNTGFIRKVDERVDLREFYWSKNGKTLVTKSVNGTYQTWNAQTGAVVALTEAKPPIELIVPDKKDFYFTKDYGGITVTDSQSGEVKTFKEFGNNSAFASSNDGQMIAEGGSWGDAAIKITNVKTGKFWWLDGHPSIVSQIVFSPDGKYLAVGGSDKIIYIFDAATHALVKQLSGHQKTVNSLTFSPDGKTLISSGENESVKVWNWREGKSLLDIESNKGIFGVNQVLFSPDGEYFLTKSNGTEFRLWDAKTYKLIHDYKTAEKYQPRGGVFGFIYDTAPVSSVNFSSDGQKIISAHQDDSVRIWNVGDGKQIKKFKACDEISYAAFINGNKNFLASCESNEIVLDDDKADRGQIKIYDAESGRETFIFNKGQTGFIQNISISPDRRHFATSGVLGEILLWSVNNPGSVRGFVIGFSGDDALAFSPDGKTLAVGGRNQNLFMFDVETGKKLWQLIASYRPGKLELKLEKESDQRRTKLNEAKIPPDARAAIETEKYRQKIYLTFEHYGEMSDVGEKRVGESAEPKESKIRKPHAGANAVWLRLHNDSPLPVEIPAQSMYLPNEKCFFELAGGKKIDGLCTGSEISIRPGLNDKNGNWIPFGFDFGSSAILLPKTSVLFPVPLEILKNGNRITFDFKFQNMIDAEKIGDYGTAKELSFGEKDLPR